MDEDRDVDMNDTGNVTASGRCDKSSIKGMLDALDKFAVRVSSGGKLDAGEAADLLDAVTGVCVAFAPDIMEAFQNRFMDLAHAAGESEDGIVGAFAQEIWSSLKVIPAAFDQMADVSRQVRNRLDVVGRLEAGREKHEHTED